MILVSLAGLSFVSGSAFATTSEGIYWDYSGYDGNSSFYMTSGDLDTIQGQYYLSNVTSYSGLQNYSVPNQPYSTLNGLEINTGGNATTGPYGHTVRSTIDFQPEGSWSSDYVEIKIPISVAGYTENKFNHTYPFNQTVGENNISLKLSGFPDLNGGSLYYFTPLTDTGANATGIIVNNDSSYFGDFSLGLDGLSFLLYALSISNPYIIIPILGASAISDYAGTLGSANDVAYHNATRGTNSIWQRFGITSGQYYGSIYNSSGHYANSYFTEEQVTIDIYTSDFSYPGAISLSAQNYISMGYGPTLQPLSSGEVERGAAANVSIPLVPGNLLEGTVVNNGTDQSSNIPVSNQEIDLVQTYNGTVTNFYEKTDSSGNYQFYAEPGASYVLKAITPEGNFSTSPKNIGSNNYNSTTLDLNLSIPGTVTFSQTGLTPGESWSVSVDGQNPSSSSSSISFSLPYGTYSYTVSGPQGYSVSPQSGTIDVNNVQTQQNVTFALESSDLVQGTVYMNDQPAPDTEILLVNYSTSNPTDSYYYSNSSGQYQLSVAPMTEYLLTVTGSKIGGDLIYAADYEGGTYNLYLTNLTFTESGIVGSNTWSVSLSGLGTPTGTQSYTTSTSGSNVTIPVVGNETYGYEITPPPDYAPSPRSSNVNVGKTTTQVDITFTAESTYSVTFSTNLASGDYWEAYLAGEGKSSSSPSITFTGMPDGNYSWSASDSYEGTYPYGHYMVPSPSTGTVTVSGSNVNVQLTYHPENSVSGNTPILMANGSYMLADQIIAGMQLGTYNLTTHHIQGGTVLTVTKDSQNASYIINGILNLSSDQLVLTNNGWMQAKNLSKGDQVVNPFTGRYTKVHSVQVEHGNFTMYGFIVGTNDNYIAWNYVLYGK